jgi:hypothetical protein
VDEVFPFFKKRPRCNGFIELEKDYNLLHKTTNNEFRTLKLCTMTMSKRIVAFKPQIVSQHSHAPNDQ